MPFSFGVVAALVALVSFSIRGEATGGSSYSGSDTRNTPPAGIPSIKVTRVPEFLFSSSSYYVPIFFTIENKGNWGDIISIDVRVFEDVVSKVLIPFTKTKFEKLVDGSYVVFAKAKDIGEDFSHVTGKDAQGMDVGTKYFSSSQVWVELNVTMPNHSIGDPSKNKFVIKSQPRVQLKNPDGSPVLTPEPESAPVFEPGSEECTFFQYFGFDVPSADLPANGEPLRGKGVTLPEAQALEPGISHVKQVVRTKIPHEWPEAKKELNLGLNPDKDVCEAKTSNTATSISAGCALTNTRTHRAATGNRADGYEYFAVAGGIRRRATVFVSYGGKTYPCLGSAHAMDLDYESGLLDMTFAPSGSYNITKTSGIPAAAPNVNWGQLSGAAGIVWAVTGGKVSMAAGVLSSFAAIMGSQQPPAVTSWSRGAVGMSKYVISPGQSKIISLEEKTDGENAAWSVDFPNVNVKVADLAAIEFTVNSAASITTVDEAHAVTSTASASYTVTNPENFGFILVTTKSPP